MKLYFTDLKASKNTIKISTNDGASWEEFPINHLKRYGFDLPDGVSSILIRGINSDITNVDVLRHLNKTMQGKPEIHLYITLASSSSMGTFYYNFNSGRAFMGLSLQDCPSWLSDSDGGNVSLDLNNMVGEYYTDGIQDDILGFIPYRESDEDSSVPDNEYYTAEYGKTFQELYDEAKCKMWEEIRTYSDTHYECVKLANGYEIPIIFD